MKKIILIYILLISASYSKEIELWYGWIGEEKEYMVSAVSKYEKISGDKVNITRIPFYSLASRFSAVAGNGTGPDIIVGPSDWIGKFLIDELIEELDERIEENVDEFLPELIDGVKYKNKIYGVPESYKTVALVYNKSMVKEPPKTTDDLIRIGKENTNFKEERYGLLYDVDNYYYHYAWLSGFGGGFFDDENKPLFDTKAQIDALNFVNDLVYNYEIMPEDSSEEVAKLLLLDNKAAMAIMGSWEMKDLYESSIEFGVADIPTISSNGKKAKPLLGVEVYMLSKYSKNKNRAFRLIEFLTSEEVQVEGLNYGHIPSRKSVYSLRRFKKNKLRDYMEAYSMQKNSSVPMSTKPELHVAVWGIGTEMLTRVISGGEDANEVVKELQKKSDDIIEEYRKNIK